MTVYYQGEDIPVAFTISDEAGTLLDPAVGQFEIRISVNQTLVKILTDNELSKDSTAKTVAFTLPAAETLNYNWGTLKMEIKHDFGRKQKIVYELGELKESLENSTIV